MGEGFYQKCVTKKSLPLNKFSYSPRTLAKFCVALNEGIP